MWILVGSFLGTIIFSWGMGGFKTGGQLDGVVGKVGRKEILYDQYNRVVQDRLAQERKQNPDAEINDAAVKRIRNQVWDDLVRLEIMDAYRDKLGLVVADEEVAFAVRNNPPSWIQQNENFQTDGVFDPALYETFLRDPSSANLLIAIESDYRQSLGNQKVIDRVISPVFVTEDEIWDEFLATTPTYQAVIASFPISGYSVDSSLVTENDVESYYRENIYLYQRDEQRRMAYVEIPSVMTAEDSNRVVTEAEELIERIREGENFAELAEAFSDDPGSAARGGDLGYFSRGRMVAPFDSAAFATEPGQVTGPIRTQFGVHIIKVEDRKESAEGDSVSARHILLSWEVSPETEERIGQKARDFSDAVSEEGFSAAAQRFELEVQETSFFSKTANGNIPGIGPLKPAMDFAFASKLGAVSYVYRTNLRGKNNYLIFQLLEIQPAGDSPVSEVEAAIRNEFFKQQKVEQARGDAAGFRSRISTVDEFLTVAERESLKVDTTEERHIRDFTRVFGTDESIGRKLMELEPGQISDVLSNDRGAFVGYLLSKTPVDSSLFQAQKSQIEDRLRRTKQNRVYGDWLVIAKDEIGVADKRYLYYTDY